MLIKYWTKTYKCPSYEFNKSVLDLDFSIPNNICIPLTTVFRYMQHMHTLHSALHNYSSVLVGVFATVRYFQNDHPYSTLEWDDFTLSIGIQIWARNTHQATGGLGGNTYYSNHRALYYIVVRNCPLHTTASKQEMELRNWGSSKEIKIIKLERGLLSK